MKLTAILGGAVMLGCTSALSQTTDNLVLQGRAQLTAKNLTNANSFFQAAVAKAPDHQTANALYAATRLISLPYQQPAQDMMDRLGVSLTNRSIYEWTAKLPTDTNGVPVPPNDFNAMEAVAFVRTNILPEVTGALENLAKITDTNFILNLSQSETTISQVTIDFGDVQLLRSLLHATEFVIYTINTYNFDAQLNALYNLHSRGELTLEHLLANYPRALTFATGRDLQAARNAFQNAVERYLVASEMIQSRRTNVVRLFNYDPEMATDEARFRQTLAELNTSWNSPVSLTYVTNKTGHIRVELGRAFDGLVPLRELLPRVRNGGVLLGSLPDRTFGGLIYGLSESEFYTFLAGRFNFELLSNFRPIRHLIDGRVQLELNAADGHRYAIEATADLAKWTEIASAVADKGLLTFIDQASTLSSRFYRAIDLSVNGRGNQIGVGALANLQGQEINLTPAGRPPQKYIFSTQGNNFTLFDAAGNVVVTGTYTYDPVSNTARLTVTPAGAAASQVIILVFTGLNAGVYSGTYATTDPNGVAISGSFQAQAMVAPPPPPAEVCGDGIDNNGNGQIDENCPPPPPPAEVCGDGIDNNGNGQIDENCPPPGGVNAPATISGQRLQLQTLTGGPGGQELITLTSATAFTSDIGATGVYTYTPTGASAVLGLQYQAPDAFKDDHYELTLTFATTTTGTFSGNQHFGGQDHQTTGNFTLSN